MRAVGVMLLPMVQDLVDPRRRDPDVAFTADERGLLEAWLEFHRMTLMLKCEGLDDSARKSRRWPPPSSPCMGLCATWPRWSATGSARAPTSTGPPTHLRPPVDEDCDLAPLDDADWDADLAAWRPSARRAAAAANTHALDDIGDAPRRALLAALDLCAHDRGVRAPQRPRRSHPRAHRRPVGW